MQGTRKVRWYRYGSSRWMCAFMLAALDAVAVPPLVIFGINYPGPVYWAVAVVAVFVVPPVAVYACLVLRAGIGVSREYVHVRSGGGHTAKIPWADVTGFAIHVAQGRSDTNKLEVLTTDGQWHASIGCAPGGMTSRSWDLIRSLDDARPAWAPAAASELPARPSEPGPGARWIVRVFASIGIAAYLAVCALIVQGGRADLGPALQAARGEGTPGYYIPQSICNGKGCQWVGEFRLPDGAVTRRNIGLLDAGAIDRDDPGATVQAGVPVPALDTSAAGGVYPRDDPAADNSAASEIAVGISLAALLLAMVGSVLGRRAEKLVARLIRQ